MRLDRGGRMALYAFSALRTLRFPVAASGAENAAMLLRAASLTPALAGLLVAGWAASASAHGDHDWIRKGGYLGVDGTRCCGQDDCDLVPASRVERTQQGYRLRDFGMTVPFRQAKPSEDGKFWLCRDDRAAMRCFFAPPPGS